jgi:hypothetical protein
MNWNPECYRCKNEGWVINTLGVYITCPVCHNSRLIRILKQTTFNLILELFKFSSDYLKKINWASSETLHFQRLYNVELEGKIEKRQPLPFENYEVAFETGNEVFKNKISYKLISEYVVGYTVNLDLLRLAVKELVVPEKVETICVSLEQAHGAALLGKDRSQEFYKELNDNLKN